MDFGVGGGGFAVALAARGEKKLLSDMNDLTRRGHQNEDGVAVGAEAQVVNDQGSYK